MSWARKHGMDAKQRENAWMWPGDGSIPTFERVARWHCTANQYASAIRNGVNTHSNDPDAFEWACLVRHPVDRMVSEYFWQKQNGFKFVKPRFRAQCATMKGWWYHEKENPAPHNHGVSQAEFLRSVPSCCRVFKLESEIQNLATFLNVEIPHANKSKDKDLSCIDFETLEDVFQHFKRDSELLGYTFQDSKMVQKLRRHVVAIAPIISNRSVHSYQHGMCYERTRNEDAALPISGTERAKWVQQLPWKSSTFPKNAKTPKALATSGNVAFLGFVLEYHGHWIVEFLPRLKEFINARNAGREYDAIVLLEERPDVTAGRRRVLETLALLGVFDIPVVFVRANDGCIQFSANNFDVFLPCFEDPAPFRFLVSASCQFAEASFPQHIFLPRETQSCTGRVIVRTQRCCNEDELEKSLAAQGFCILDPARLSVTAQIAVFSHARVLAARPGTGLHNAVFMGKGATCISLCDPARPEERPLQARLCRIAGVNLKQVPFVGTQTAAEFSFDVSAYSDVLCDSSVAATRNDKPNVADKPWFHTQIVEDEIEFSTIRVKKNFCE